MNAKTLLLSIGLAVGTASSFAMAPMTHPGAATPLTRSAVIMQFNQARASGQLPATGETAGTTSKLSVAMSDLTRADVMTRLAQAHAAGTLPASGEAGGTAVGVTPHVGSSALTRAAVIAETRRALATGQLRTGGEV
jgi:hypothetical protein